MNLIEKIDTRDAVVSVIGLGYVGLPLAVAFAEAGFRVVGIDTNQERVNELNRGISYVQDVASEKVAALAGAHPAGELQADSAQQGTAGQDSALRQVGRLTATTNYDVLHDADVVIICVPTPLSKTKDPDLSYIISVTDQIARRMHSEMLIVLESTTYPGTTVEIVLPRLQSGNRDQFIEAGTNGTNGRVGAHLAHEALAASRDTAPSEARASVGRFHVGADFFLAFSPERIDPGRKDYTFENTPKVIGGVTPQCTQSAMALYGSVIEQVVPVSSPKVAEMVKLLENTFRAVNIALVNEVAIMCNQLGIEVWEVIEAAKTKPFGFLPFYPGPGLGGHCIPVDPQYLAWKLKTLNYNARFIQLAAEINFSMPEHVLAKISDALNEDRKALNGSRVLILGVAYKADIGDLRESPALDLIKLLQEKGAVLSYNDDFVPRLEVNGLQLSNVTLDQNVLRDSDCVVITAAHSYYDWDWIVEHSPLIVDTRNATKSVAAGSGRIVKL